MSVEELKVEDKIVVSMEYSLIIDGGKEFSRTNQEEPLDYIHGLGLILPGLENELYGMKIGDEKEVTLDAVSGYGEYLQEEIAQVSREAFPANFDLKIGKGVTVRDHETGEQYIGYITEIKPEAVELDFNHPLAGKELHFSVKIVGLRPASEEELTHGHVHGAGQTH